MINNDPRADPTVCYLGTYKFTDWELLLTFRITF